MPAPTYIERVHLRGVLLAELVDVMRDAETLMQQLVLEAELDTRNHRDGPDLGPHIAAVAEARERIDILTTSVECVSLACLSLS